MVRVELMNGMFDLPQETKDAMNEIREVLEEADRKLAQIFIEPTDDSGTAYKDRVLHDKGRVIAGFDLVQQAKNVMIDGLLFKHATAKEIKNKEGDV